MPSPRVSIVVTCYNLGGYIEEALDSVRRQTFTDYELVVVDDGSDDAGTLTTLNRLREAGTRVLRTPNRGLPAARNAGIAATSGEFVCCLDADDRLRPNFLERSVTVLDSAPQTAFASHWLRTFGDEEDEWRPERCDFPSLLDMNSINGAALVRRTVVEAVGGFDESFLDGCEDWDFWISVVESGHEGTIIPEVLFEYRRRPGSMSRTMIEQIGHPEMYSRLVSKHKASYKTHLLPLLLRREATTLDLQTQLRDLEIESERHLLPELRGLRDDIRLLQERGDRSRRKRLDDEAMAELKEQSERAKTNLAAGEADLAAARADLSETRENFQRAQENLAGREADLAAARADLSETRESFQRAQENLGAVEQDLAGSRTTAEQMAARLKQAEQEVVALRNSLTWRLTKPLRRVYDLLFAAGGNR